MTKSSVLVLYNQPLLPAEHPDAASEHTIIEIAERMAGVLNAAGFRVSMLALGTDPGVLWRELKQRAPDAVFNLYEGQLDNAESETYVAGLLEWSGIPYTGSRPRTLSLARAKDLSKYLLKGAGLPSADFLVVSDGPAPVWTPAFPVIVKPARMDASVGISQQSVCVSQAEIEDRVRYLFVTYGSPVLIERYITGREIHVPLIEVPRLQALPPLEIGFPDEKTGGWSILSYERKWGPAAPQKTRADLPDELRGRLADIALKAYRLLGCRHYARVDFRMSERGEIFILEVNPNPEISEDSGFGPESMPVDVFVVRLVEETLREHALRRAGKLAANT